MFNVAMLELAGLNMILALSVYATFMVGQFSLAQVGFWSIGAYVTGILTSLWGLPLLPSLAASAAICAIAGLLLGYPCLRIRGIYLAMATIAFVEVVKVAFANIEYYRDINGVATGPAGALGFRGIRVMTAWPEILIALVVVIGLFVWLERTRVGLSAKAIREDELAAAAAGINVVAIKVAMFTFSASIAAVGGGLYATCVSFVNGDNFSFHLALQSIFFVAVGGATSALGPVVGALLLTMLPEALRFAGEYRMIVYGVLVLLITVFCPRGVVNEIWQRLRLLRQKATAAVARRS